MPDLIERLKRNNLGNGYLSDTDACYLKLHVVPDLVQNVKDVKIVFLVESPHKQEVCD